MLRITQQRLDKSAIVLRLEGKLLEDWIDELLRSLRSATVEGSGLQLDLSALTFADAAGQKVLAQLIDDGVTITACSGYVAALLHVEKP